MNNSVSNLMSSVTGNVEKGYLLMHAYEDVNNDQNLANNQGVAAVKSSFGSSKLSSIVSSANNLGRLTDFGKLVGYKKYNTLQVQYNPSSISMSSTRGEIVNKSVGGGGENNYQQYHVSPRTTMSVELIFDYMNMADCFTLWNNASQNGLYNYAKKYVVAGLEGGYTVRPVVETIVGAMATESTRQVIFVWNKMVFGGEMTSVDAEYTMFNRKGEPVRAKVTIGIFQENNKDETGKDLGTQYWKNAYDNLFKSTAIGGGSAGRQMDYASNIINW